MVTKTAVLHTIREAIESPRYRLTVPFKDAVDGFYSQVRKSDVADLHAEFVNSKYCIFDGSDNF